MDILIYIHSYLRWVVLALGLVVIVKAFLGLRGGLPFSKSDNGLGAAYTGSMHLQLILGLILYFIGNWGVNLFDAGMGEVMKNETARFWAVEHITMMILAVVVATIGRSKSKRAGSNVAQHKQALLFYGISMILVLSRIPWPPLRELFKGIA